MIGSICPERCARTTGTRTANATGTSGTFRNTAQRVNAATGTVGEDHVGGRASVDGYGHDRDRECEDPEQAAQLIALHPGLICLAGHASDGTPPAVARRPSRDGAASPPAGGPATCWYDRVEEHVDRGNIRQAASVGFAAEPNQRYLEENRLVVRPMQ